MTPPSHPLGAWGRSRRGDARRPTPEPRPAARARCALAHAGPAPRPAPPLPGPGPLPPPSSRRRLLFGGGGGGRSSGAASGRRPARRSSRAAMELEVPDEAESAEAGAVTSEAAWAAESGAAAGNSAGPPSLAAPRVGPPGLPTPRPSGAARAPEGRRDPPRGGQNVPLGGARGMGGMGRPARGARGGAALPGGSAGAGRARFWEAVGQAAPFGGVRGTRVLTSGRRGDEATRWVGALPPAEGVWGRHPTQSCWRRGGGALLSVCGTVEHPPSGEGPCFHGGHGREVTLSQMGPPFLDVLLWAARLAGVSFWDHSCGHVFWW